MIHSLTKPTIIAFLFSIATVAMLCLSWVASADARERDRKRGYHVIAGGHKPFATNRRHYNRGHNRLRGFGNRHSRGNRNRGFRVIAGRDGGSITNTLTSSSRVNLVQPIIQLQQPVPLEIKPLRPVSRIIKVSDELKRLGARRAALRNSLGPQETFVVIAGKTPRSNLGTNVGPVHVEAPAYWDEDPDEPAVIYFND